MKQATWLILIGGLFFFHTLSSQSEAFITDWKTDNPGSSNSTSITIPTIGSLTYDYDVDWDDDGVYEETGITGSVTHNFGAAGTYTIRIKGTFPAIQFNNVGDRRKLIEISQWGDIAWENMNSAFEGCESLDITASDDPDLTLVSSMSQMFKDATNFTGDLSGWDVSNVTQMVGTFQETDAFDSDISGWNISNVTNINSMFFKATAFDQDISGWTVAQLTELRRLFLDASSFNQDLGDWDVSSVTDMTDMFSNSGMSRKNYGRTLTGWSSLPFVQPNVVLGASGMKYCFGANARHILTNLPFDWDILGDIEDCQGAAFITKWKTDNPGGSTPTSISIVTSGGGYNYDIDWENDGIYDEFGVTGFLTHDYGVAGTFEVAIKGDFPRITFFSIAAFPKKIIDVLQWGDIEWSSMERAFSNCTNLRITAIDSPDLTNCSSLSSMFNGATSFNDPIEHWDISNVTNITSMFSGATSFNQPLNDWGPFINNLVSLTNVFQFASSFNQSIDNWDVSNIRDLSSLFNGASSFNQPLDSWSSKVTKVENMRSMFNNASSFNQNLNGWQTDSLSKMENIFKSATSFNGSLDNWNTSKVTEMYGIFEGATAFNQPLETWEIVQVTTFKKMFLGATSFNQPLNWNTASLEDTRSMFSSATSFNQSLGGWDVSNLSQADNMLNNSGLSIINYDQTLIGWSTQTLMPDVNVGAAGLSYCSSYEARNSTLPDKGWSLNGDEAASIACNPDCGFLTNELELSGEWHHKNGGWSLAETPNFCHNVLIPTNLTLTHEQNMYSSLNEAQGSTLQVDAGAVFTVDTGAILIIYPVQPK